MKRQEGFMMVELVIAMSILLIGLLGFCGAFTSNFKATNDVKTRDQISVDLKKTAETLRSADFNTLYFAYNSKTINGVTVTCYIDESAIPSQFGVTDIDGNTSTINKNVTSYRVLPVRLSKTFPVGDKDVELKELFIVIGRN